MFNLDKEYAEAMAEYRSRIEERLGHLVAQGHLIQDLALCEQVLSVDGAVIFEATITHRPSGRLLTTIN